MNIQIADAASIRRPSGSVHSSEMYCGLVIQTSIITAIGSAPMMPAEAFASIDIA